MILFLRAVTLAIFAVVVLPASAQQPSPPLQQQSPNERAMASKLITEINLGLQCNTQLISAMDRIASLEKELTDLRAKVPPPPASK